MLQEIKTLVQTLNEQRDAYYNKDSPKIPKTENRAGSYLPDRGR